MWNMVRAMAKPPPGSRARAIGRGFSFLQRGSIISLGGWVRCASTTRMCADVVGSGTDGREPMIDPSAGLRLWQLIRLDDGLRSRTSGGREIAHPFKSNVCMLPCFGRMRHCPAAPAFAHLGIWDRAAARTNVQTAPPECLVAKHRFVFLLGM